VRVSTAEQVEHGHSIEEQRDRLQDYCRAKGWKDTRLYTDAGFSGASINRPALQSLLQDVRAKKVSMVLVYKLDRLSRSQKDTLMLIEDVFLSNGCDFVSLSENFDTSSPFGRAMIGILAVFAQLEREQIKERLTMGRIARAKKGKFSGSPHVPIGYDYQDGDLIVNDFEAMQVRRIFEDYASGMSPYSIAKSLNEAGLCHKYGKWTDNAVRTLLPRKTYIGEVSFNGEWYQGIHEPIIDRELFDRVNAIKSRKHDEHDYYNRRAGKANSYLGGYCTCGMCGSKYTKDSQSVTVKGKKYKYAYYSCTARHRKDPQDPSRHCTNKRWRMQELDDLVFNEIKKLSLEPDRVTHIHEDTTPIIKAEISKIDDQLSRLLDLYSAEHMPLDILQERISALQGRKTHLQEQMEQETDTKTLEQSLEMVNSFDTILEHGDFYEIRAVIGALIDNIVIDGDDVSIHWRF
jgi:site-specific DNA recombinase